MIILLTGMLYGASIIPNPSSADALLKLPSSLDSKSLQLRVIDMAGKELERRIIASSTGWTKLNASGYASGTYLIEIVSGEQLVAHERWIVNH